MLFEWDASKNEDCFIKRGFDFEFAGQVLFDPKRLMSLDNRRSYGEKGSFQPAKRINE
jgi:uncharacterized DUF497 family protein